MCPPTAATAPTLLDHFFLKITEEDSSFVVVVENNVFNGDNDYSDCGDHDTAQNVFNEDDCNYADGNGGGDYDYGDGDDMIVIMLMAMVAMIMIMVIVMMTKMVITLPTN